jgi:AhpD family alkylhydroperoxidase
MRIPIAKTSPEGYRKVNALDAYVEGSLEPSLKNLIYLRASQLNGCNYCVDSHSADLLSDGLPVRKVFAVTTWRESAFFTPRERVALELAESITGISGGIGDDLWSRANDAFSARELGDVILAVGTINLWNRIAISTRLQPDPLEQEAGALI